MPNAIGWLTALANIGSDRWTKPICTASDRLISHIDAAFSEQFLDVSQAQCEAKVEPHGVSDNVGMKAMTLEGNGLHSPLFSKEFLQVGDGLALD